MKSSKDAPTYQKIGAGYNLTRQADPFLVAKIESLLNIDPYESVPRFSLWYWKLYYCASRSRREVDGDRPIICNDSGSFNQILKD